jgi:hypothetical protein
MDGLIYCIFGYRLRALFGSDATRNAVHGSDSVESAARELDLVFNTFSAGVQTTYDPSSIVTILLFMSRLYV